MRWRRNADEGAQRRRRAMSSDPSLVNAVVADKIRAGHASEITLGELGSMNSRELVQRIPTEVWKPLIAKVGLTPREELIPFRIGPVDCALQVATGDAEYPSLNFHANGYARSQADVLMAIEYAKADGGPLQFLAFGNPFDQDGAPTHYLRFIPFREDLDERWEGRAFPREADQGDWDARSILGNP